MSLRPLICHTNLIFDHIFIYNALNFSSDIHFTYLVVITGWEDPVGEKDINQLIFRVDPDKSPCIT